MSLFRTEAARVCIAEWAERFRAQLPVATERREVATRFGATGVLVGGPADAPKVVVLHGALASAAHALVELAPLLARFRVYAVEVIGQSVHSAPVQLSVTNNDYGAWLCDVLDALPVERPHVVGVSWGGFAGIRLAVHAPARIDRLALLVPAGVVKGPAWAGLTKLGLPMLRYRLAPTPASRDRLLGHLLSTPGDDWTPYLGDAFLAYRMKMRVPKRATPDELAGFTRPTLVIGAERDLSFPGAPLIARAAQIFPTLAGTELIAGARHCPPTSPDFRRWLGERLINFLTA